MQQGLQLGLWLLSVMAVVGSVPGHSAPFIPLQKSTGRPLPECKSRVLFKAERGKDYFSKESHTYSKFYKRINRGQCYKKKLVLVYMGADNDLSPWSWRDIAEMEQVGSTLDVDVVLFQDDAQVNGMRYYHIAKRPPNFYKDYKKQFDAFVKEKAIENLRPDAQEDQLLTEIGPSLPVSPIIKLLPEGNSGDVKTAGAFIRYALKRYPAERVMLLGWSHGLGIGGFSFDFDSKSHMQVPDMVAGLKHVIQTVRKGRRFDWAGSDSCLNLQSEVALEWFGITDYLFGSAALLQAKGFNYGSFLRNFNSRTDYPKAEKLYLEDLELLVQGKKAKHFAAHYKSLPPREAQAAEPFKKKLDFYLQQKKKEKNFTTWIRKQYLAEDTRYFAKNIPAIYGSSVATKTSDLRRSHYDPHATMAVLEMAQIHRLQDSLEDLGTALVRWLLEPKDGFDRINRKADLLELVIEETHRFEKVSADLYNFASNLQLWVAEERKHHDKSSRSYKTLLKITQEAGNIQNILRGSDSLPGAVLSMYIGEHYQSAEGLVPWKSSYAISLWLPQDGDQYDKVFSQLRVHSRLYKSKEDPKKLSNYGLFMYLLYCADDVLEKMAPPI